MLQPYFALKGCPNNAVTLRSIHRLAPSEISMCPLGLGREDDRAAPDSSSPFTIGKQFGIAPSQGPNLTVTETVGALFPADVLSE